MMKFPTLAPTLAFATLLLAGAAHAQTTPPPPIANSPQAAAQDQQQGGQPVIDIVGGISAPMPIALSEERSQAQSGFRAAVLSSRPMPKLVIIDVLIRCRSISWNQQAGSPTKASVLRMVFRWRSGVITRRQVPA